MQHEEEGLREFFKFEDLGNEQDQTALDAINRTVVEKYLIMGSKNFQRSVDKTVQNQVDDLLEKQTTAFRQYVGPAAGRPKKPSMFWVWEQKKNISKELQRKFLIEAADKAERGAHDDFFKVRFSGLLRLWPHRLLPQRGLPTTSSNSNPLLSLFY
jgi:hypothetical protein